MPAPQMEEILKNWEKTPLNHVKYTEILSMKDRLCGWPKIFQSFYKIGSTQEIRPTSIIWNIKKTIWKFWKKMGKTLLNHVKNTEIHSRALYF